MPGAIGLIPVAIPTCFVLFLLGNGRFSAKMEIAFTYHLSVLVLGTLMGYDATMIGVRTAQKFGRIVTECMPHGKGHRNIFRNLANYRLLRKPQAWPSLPHLTRFACANPSHLLVKNLARIAPLLSECAFEGFQRSALRALPRLLRAARHLKTLTIKATLEPSSLILDPPPHIDMTELHLDESKSLTRFECANIFIFAFARLSNTTIKELIMTHYMASDELYLWQTRLTEFLESGVFDGLETLYLDPDELWTSPCELADAIAALKNAAAAKNIRLELDRKHTRALLASSVSNWDADADFFIF